MAVFFEEELLKKMILKDFAFIKKNIHKINFERLVKIASSNLILPTIYIAFRKIKFIDIPSDLKKYLEFIYNANYTRNLKLIVELNNISNILIENKIKFNFIKGAELTRLKIYDDLGERMLGDIDIVINKKQEEKTIEILNKHGYKRKIEYKFWNTVKKKPLVNINKIFSIDLHTNVDLKNSFDKEFKILSKSRGKEKTSFLLNYCIHNFLIGDSGLKFANYNYRMINDYFKIVEYSADFKIQLHKSQESRFFSILLSHLNLLDKHDLKLSFIENLYKLRLRLNKVKIISIINYVVIKSFNRIKKIPFQLVEIIFNSKYRDNALKNFSK